MRKTLTAIAAGLFALTASACNTVAGAGEDIESVADAANDAI